MRLPRWLYLTASFCAYAVVLIGVAHADPSAAARASPDKGANLVRLLMTGPIVFLIFAASFAVVMSVSLMARAEIGLAGVIERCAMRVSVSRPLLTAWGLAFVVVIIVVSATLFKIRILGIVGLLLLIAGLLIAGVGLAASAAEIGGRWSNATSEPQLPLAPRIGRGMVLTAGASVIPLIGWIVAIFAVLGGVGAVVESLFAKRQ